jgi:glycosyltransferase involved in cell wall biosynthesis
MRKPVLTIFYQYDPWNSSIGGIQSLVGSFIKYTPPEFRLRFVGISSDPTVAVGTWHEAELYGRSLLFMPLFCLADDNVKHLIPTSIKYTLALAKRGMDSDFLHFHRLEPTVATLPWQGEKTLFIHNDIQKQMQSQGKQSTLLWQRFPAVYFALEGLLVRQFSQILSCNSESVQLYQSRYPAIASKVSRFQSSVDDEVFYPLPSPERQEKRRAIAVQRGLPLDTRLILFAGRLHPQKDPLLLVRAIAALDDPAVHLLIAGDGEMADAVRQEIEGLGLSSRVSMLGATDRATMAELYRVAHLFILTSVYEGLPVTVLEALASGTPVLTTRCGETPRILKSDSLKSDSLKFDSGLVCDERTPGAIAAAIRQILDHPEQYPAESCIQTAVPFGAKAAIRPIYDQTLERWERRMFHA